MINSLILAIAALLYAISVYIDVFVWHFRYYSYHNENNRYLISLSNILQYSARGFILIYAPIMAFFTEKFQDKSMIFWTTILAHFFVILLVYSTLSTKLSSTLSHMALKFLNFYKIPIETTSIVNANINKVKETKIASRQQTKHFFLIISTLASFLFATGGSMIYYFSFHFPNRILFMTSQSQIINMMGTLAFVLFIDPTISKALDANKGFWEIKKYSISRIIAHSLMIVGLLLINFFKVI